MPTPKVIVDVSAWELAGVEPTGLDEKDWLRDPEDRWPWMFKPVPTSGEGTSGENWAEVVAADIADLLEIPHARVQLARRDGVEGCICKKFQRSDWQLQHGSTLLSGTVADFDPLHHERLGHSLTNIARALEPLGPPPQAGLSDDFPAFGVFAGYLVLDALIANRDRHSSNWAVLRPPPGDGRDVLAPSYDHGSSLGFNVPEAKRVRVLGDGTIADWVGKATAYRFERAPGARIPSLCELARDALALCDGQARQHWLERVQLLDREAVTVSALSVPGLSEATANFIIEIVMTNRGRILDQR